jgi:hypothetical protein
VGDAVGEAVVLAVGDAVGEAVGLAVGAALGAGVTPVELQLRSLPRVRPPGCWSYVAHT